MSRCVVLGAGGHARVLIDVIQAAGNIEVACVLDRDETLWGKEIYGIPIAGGDDRLFSLKADGVSGFVVAVGSTGDNGPRARIFRAALEFGLTPVTVVAATAFVSRRAVLERGCQVLSRAVVNPGAVVGENSIINTGAIIEHDCVIGRHVHIAPGAVLSGMVRVGDMAHVGTGASVRQAVEIGAGAVVGVGAAVVNDVAPGHMVAGVPAKTMKIV